MPATDHAHARNICVGAVLASYLLMFACFAFTKISVDFAKIATVYRLIVILVALGAAAHVAKIPRLPSFFAVAACCVAVGVPIGVWSYAAVSIGMPLADGELAQLDAALGFDWRAFIAYVDARPLLERALDLAYDSFVPQVFCVPMYFALSGEARHAYAVLFSYILLCLVASVASVWWPALSAYYFYGVGQGDLTNLDAHYGYFFLEQFRAVREAEAFELVFREGAGLLTFPSIHAGVAGLCAWAGWRSRVLRWPLLALNAAMAVAAVSHGSHYLVDVIAGLGVAGLSIAVTTALFERRAWSRSPVLKRAAGRRQASATPA